MAFVEQAASLTRGEKRFSEASPSCLASVSVELSRDGIVDKPSFSGVITLQTGPPAILFRKD
jgi:hypothetical protein